MEIAEICGELKKGRVVVYPTDTLYGLGADPFDEDAVMEVFRLKRMETRVLSVAFSSIEQAERYAEVPEWVKNLLPGPITIVTRARKDWKYITKEGKIGIRVPDNRTALELLENCGPLTSTSANIHGKEAKTLEEIKSIFGNSVIYIEGEEPKYREPSTIIDITDGLKIIRNGAMSGERIKLACEK